MYDFNDPQQDERILKALRKLREMPNYLIIDGSEERYRKEVLEYYKLTEDALTTFFDMKETSGLSLAEHALELRKKALEFRKDFLEKINRLLDLCIEEDEKLECLNEYYCNYSSWAYETDMWRRHQFKSFKGFAQWHIEQGGWNGDTQGNDFEDFARSWALDWMAKWTGQQLTEIGMRRHNDDQRNENQVIIESDVDSESDPAIIELPSLSITELERAKLLKAFSPFIKVNELALFTKLLSQEVIVDKITIKHQQNSIAYVFRQAAEAGHIKADKTKIRDWILYWFRVDNGKCIKSLTPRTVYDALTKDTSPNKNKRILYRP